MVMKKYWPTNTPDFNIYNSRYYKGPHSDFILCPVIWSRMGFLKNLHSVVLSQAFANSVNHWGQRTVQ